MMCLNCDAERIHHNPYLRIIMTTKRVKLTYFDHTWGRALAIRIALRISQAKFEDKRIRFPEFLKLRTSEGQSDEVPLGFLPIVELPSGQISSQSMSIARWAGKVAGIYPLEDFDAALLVDEVMESVLEITDNIPPMPEGNGNHDTALKKRREYAMKVIPKYLNFLAKKYENGGFLLGSELSIADLIVFQVFYNIKGGFYGGVEFNDTILKYPVLSQLYEDILELDCVQQELEADKLLYSKNEKSKF